VAIESNNEWHLALEIK